MLPPPRRIALTLVACAAAIPPSRGAPAEAPILETFRRDIEPVLDRYCWDCHGFGKSKGGVVLDEFADAESLRDPALWLRVLKNTRAQIMPPLDEPPLPAADREKIAAWIKREAFGLDARHPDPGHVTVRRLNRVEYRNTVRDLLGVDFDTEKEFPPDDTGHGFDNLGEVLTISPMLFEKYLNAAQAIVTEAVPVEPWVVETRTVPGREFAARTARPEPPAAIAGAPVVRRPAPARAREALDLSYYTPVTVGATHRAAHDGIYRVAFSLRAVEQYVDDQFDLNRCRLRLRIDGELLADQEFQREGDRKYAFEFERSWRAGDHELEVEIEPLGPDRDQIRNLRLRLEAVRIRGPFAREHFVRPARYAEFFPEPVPEDAPGRRDYARRVLEKFASRAYRRPVEATTVDRLAGLALANEGAFEAGVAEAMVACLVSPRFLFREEGELPVEPGEAYPRVDEHALASRLSYFLWSTMPDAELSRLAAAGRLRTELPAQLKRMLADRRAGEFVRNFTGQWLQARDIANVPINAVDVFLREHPNPDFEPARATFQRLNRIPPEQRTAGQKAELDRSREVFRAVFRAPKPQLNDSLRDAMRRETEMSFAHVLREDRSLVELIDAGYTFLNEELAKHYGIAGVEGAEMRRVDLPPDSPRGGVLTSGTVLSVTSNPTRTSPVKRGVFILEAILGTPPAPPPPNIPALEDAATKEELARLNLRETLALHASQPLCASCHLRLDPLGLALENFNAMGAWRDRDQDQPIEPAGRLITGEKFADARELKRVLATSRRRDYFYCVSEKLLTYALGRGLDYHDMDTLDQLVARLEAADGRPSALLAGIVESAPFQRRRPESAPAGRVAATTDE